jgi:AcrR family transcriptional regulator
MTLRERKKQQARAAMVEATVSLSFERGFDVVTVEEIAERAVVSRRTFFRYFASKERAFFDGHEARLVRFRESLTRPSGAEAPYARVRRCLLELAVDYDADRARFTERFRVIEQSRTLLVYDLDLDRRFEAAIVEVLSPASSDPTERLRAQVVGAALFGVVRAVLRHWFHNPDSAPLVQLGEDALQLLEEGFRP